MADKTRFNQDVEVPLCLQGMDENLQQEFMPEPPEEFDGYSA